VYQWQISTDKGTSWQDIAGANTLSYVRAPTSIGSYCYRLTVTEEISQAILACRVASNVVAVNVHDDPAVNAGPDRTSIGGTPVTLQGSVTGEDPIYYWSPPSYLDSDKILTPKATPPKDINYTLFATSAYGCKNDDAVHVTVVPEIYVPNAFTPNNDGKNDTWHISFIDASVEASVNVYNRYGQLVYHAENQTVNWDGTFNGFPQPSGTYVFSVRFKSGYPEVKGTVLLIR
jgi:gliding motility-associated-like protein